MSDSKHIESIDYIRAIMSVFVVIWHLGGAGKSTLYNSNFANASIGFADIVNFYVLLLAVPSFFFVSFYLFGLASKSLKLLYSRASRFFMLYVFWVFTFILIMNPSLGVPKLLEVAFTDVERFLFVFFSGGSTIYYFFASLLLLVFVAYALHGAGNRVLIPLLVVSVAAVAAMPQVTENTGNMLYSFYWNPLNFTPYVFLGLLVARNQALIIQHKIKILLFSLIGFLLAATYEWHYSMGLVQLKFHGYAFPPYMRPSLVFAVSIIMVWILSSQIKSNIIIRFMAKYSLALFCLHPFFLDVGRKIVGRGDFLDTLLAAGIVIAMSYVTAIILSRFLAKKILF